MADAAVAFDGTRVNNADALGSVWTDLGGGKAASEPDFVYQGTAAVSEKVGTSEGGVALDTGGTTYDYSTTPLVWIAKVIATNSGALNAKGSTGGILEIGSGGRRSAYDRYYVVGGDTYPLLGGWLIIPIDPNGGNQSARPGTAPTLSAINYWGWAADFGATSKAENVASDAVDHIAYGEGLTITDGIGSAFATGVFQDFIDYDEDTSANQRYGIVSTREGILYVTGFLNLGDSATGVEFDDSGAVVVWPDAEFLNSTGFFGIEFNAENSNSSIILDACTFISRGTTGGTADTRATVQVVGTAAGASVAINSCNFQNLYDFILTSAASVDGGSIETRNLTQGTAEIQNCTITTNSASSVACITDPTFGTTSGLHDVDFVFGSGGHALEIASAGTYTLTNIGFSGYGAIGTANSAIDVTASTGTVTINYSGGDEPTYTTAGATVVVQASITITYEGLVAGTEVRVYSRTSAGGNDVEIDGVESTAGTTFAAGLQAGVSYNLIVIAKGYLIETQFGVSYTATSSVNINLQVDPNYSNP